MSESRRIVRGRVVTPERVVVAEVHMVDGLIAEIAPLGPTAAESADSVLVVPGLIDLQVNGGHGIDLLEQPGRVGELAEILEGEGTTTWLPTIVSTEPHRRDRALSTIAGLDHPSVAGVHLEGPLLATERRGAHDPHTLVEPESCTTSGWTTAAGVAMVTLAPELPGSLPLIADLVDRGVVVALGHTDSRAEDVEAAVAAGATHVTHLFNAMRPFHHRQPGPIGAVLASDSLTAGLIVDGEHLDHRAVVMAWRCLGPDRICVVTDSVSRRGQDSATVARRSDGVLAGGMIPLHRSLVHLMEATGAGIVDAVRTVTTTPAAIIGRPDRGAIVPGRRADLCVLGADLSPRRVWIGGEPVAVGRARRER